eukprot:TRINITY_DN16595_c0_g3_i2.p1 TRINITY_DN16595_c0_g3~~TRINITY_DN16595_c0_g3_i2.p1  ORF type:complete len:1750 (-),score=255.28 TRINITY_DN16595_c0_g3_i2:53-5251(-)
MAEAGASLREVPVVVVGAGLAGLSLALFLRKKGVQVELFDRHASLEGQGVETTVGVLFQECYRACDLDLTEDLERLGTPISEYIIWDAEGNVTSRERVDAAYRAFNRRSYDVSRPELMRVLLGKFKEIGGIFHGGSSLESMEVQGEGPEARALARFSCGQQVITPSLIAADGIRSLVRHLLFDDSVPQHAGASIVYGMLPGAVGLVEKEPQAFHLCLADNFSVLTSHYRGDSPETWIGVLTRASTPLMSRSVWSEGRSESEAGAANLLATSPFWKRCLKSTQPMRWVYSGGLETRELKGDFCWFKGPVMLIGDAVHGLTPWGGYSGQMAVEDAFVLAQYFAKPSSFADVVAERRPRVLEFQAKSSQQHSGGIGDSAAVARVQADRIRELTTSPAFRLRVFVVGIAGRIGSAVARACEARGAYVSGLARSAARVPAGSKARVHEGDVRDNGWEVHLKGIDVVVCALRGMPGEVLPLQMHVLELARSAGVPRFVAADFLPDYTPALPSLMEHPMLAERIEFRKRVQAMDDISGVHMHIGCLLEADELFGFMGVWDRQKRQFSYWGDPDTRFDVSTVAHVGVETAEAIFAGKVGDVRTATATVSSRDIVEEMSRRWPVASLNCRGTLQELEDLIKGSSGLERIRLQCQRSLFAGEAPVAGVGREALGRFVEDFGSEFCDAAVPWTSPDAPGLVQVDLKLEVAESDASLRSQNLATLDLKSAWMELGRRALTEGSFHAARFAGQALETLHPDLRSSGKLWFAAVACYFTGHFEEGVSRFNAEMGANPVDAEELLWRECCLHAAGLPPKLGNATSPQLVGKDPRSVFSLILRAYLGTCPQQDPACVEKIGAPVPLSELIHMVREERVEQNLDRFYAAFYLALLMHSTGKRGGQFADDCSGLLSLAQRLGCRDNMGLLCKAVNMLPQFCIHTASDTSGYSCPRLIVGFAGLKHEPEVVEHLQACAAQGAAAVDVADIYPGAEDLARIVGSRIVHTKYVPDEKSLEHLDEPAVRSAILRTLARLGRRPHAVQLHWWGPPDEHLARVSGILEQMRHEGYFRALGVTNMDVEHLAVVRSKAKVSLGQFAFSLVDRRPLESGLAAYCAKHDIPLVAYGALCGGFLSEKWLGAAAPVIADVAPPKRKYLARIQAQGGWAEFQRLLSDANRVALRRGAKLAEVAIAWVLHHGASSVIIGPGNSRRICDAISALSLRLEPDDLALLSRPPPQSIGAQTSPQVYGDERNASHPIGQALCPWRNTSHLGPSRKDEALARASADPSRPFVAEELRILGLEEADSILTKPRALDTAGLQGAWLEAGRKIRDARCAGDSAALRAAMQTALASLGATCTGAGAATTLDSSLSAKRAMTSSSNDEPAKKMRVQDDKVKWDIGKEVAPLTAPVLLRERPAQGIGVAFRGESDPSKRRNPDWPEELPSPRVDFPLVCRIGADAPKLSLKDCGCSARRLLSERLRRHGAVLLKGLPISTASEFSDFVQGLGWTPVAKHGVSERVQYAKDVFGASDDVPSDFCLPPHNEQAYYTSEGNPTYPRRVVFCCLTPASSGGETPVALNREVLSTLRPEVVEKLRPGIIYDQRMPSGSRHSEMVQNLGGAQSWQKAFDVDSKEEVERKVKEQGCSALWGDADDLIVRRHGATFIRSSCPDIDGSESIWFNQAHNFYSFIPRYVDGTELEEDVLSHLTAEFWRHSVAFTWDRGDVLCIDNEVCTHSRTSFEGPRKNAAAFFM